MAIREIIRIDESKCDGCGQCAEGCAEGAIRIIDGKARLIGESLCDGLGACIGHCPRDAITVERREAGDYDEETVIESIAKQGPTAIKFHLEHLASHGQTAYVREGVDWLGKHGIAIPQYEGSVPAPKHESHAHEGCPGSRHMTFKPSGTGSGKEPAMATGVSELTHWPIQLHLINPSAPHFAGADVLIAADCTAFALGSFHPTLLSGKKLVIACPKLDSGRDIYLDKLATLISCARSVTVAVMEVPCCSGLVKLASDARSEGGTDKPIQTVTVGIDGTIKGLRSI